MQKTSSDMRFFFFLADQVKSVISRCSDIWISRNRWQIKIRQQTGKLRNDISSLFRDICNYTLESFHRFERRYWWHARTSPNGHLSFDDYVDKQMK